MEERADFKTYVNSGITMSFSDIGSVRTLTYDQCEQIKNTGDILNDNKHKRKKLILSRKKN